MTASAVKSGIAAWLPGMATVTVLGIPAGAFITALVASALSNTGDKAVPRRSVPSLLRTVLFHACIGGWGAVVLLHIGLFRGDTVAKIGTTVTAAVIALLIPPVRDWFKENGKAAAMDVWEIIKDWLRRMTGGKQ